MQTQRRAADRRGGMALPRCGGQSATTEALANSACGANSGIAGVRQLNGGRHAVAYHHRYRLATVRLRPEDRVRHDPCRRRAAEASRGGCQLGRIAEAFALATVPSVGNPLRRIAVIVTSASTPGRTPITSSCAQAPDTPPPHGRGGGPYGAQRRDGLAEQRTWRSSGRRRSPVGTSTQPMPDPGSDCHRVRWKTRRRVVVLRLTTATTGDFE